MTELAPVRALKGMKDVLWPASYRWEVLVATFAGLAERAGYGLVLSPVLEEARLFHRGFGDESEVVRKEMYEFDDRDRRRLALRPEGTAPVVRVFVEHHPTVPWKAWYVTPAFRHEQPQAGRFRQHHQMGVEAIGTDDPDLDVEVVALAASLYRTLGLQARRSRSQLDGLRGLSRRLRRGASRVSVRAPRRALRRAHATSSTVRCGSSIARGPNADRSRRTRRSSSTGSTTNAPRTSRGSMQVSTRSGSSTTPSRAS